ncbi:MAG: hypothetical protein R3Y62_01360 [Eubacteriales bacterium]
MRKRIRLPGFDYASHGAYFITICTHHRQSILSTISVGQEQSPCPTVGAVICALKSLSTKRTNALDGTPGRKIWHPRYYDCVVRNDQAYNEIWQYIDTNPSTWNKDRFFPMA